MRSVADAQVRAVAMIVILMLALLLVGCAARTSEPMPAGPRVLTPAGAAEYCRRHVEDELCR